MAMVIGKEWGLFFLRECARSPRALLRVAAGAVVGDQLPYLTPYLRSTLESTKRAHRRSLNPFSSRLKWARAREAEAEAKYPGSASFHAGSRELLGQLGL
jgi:hypothetical protein